MPKTSHQRTQPEVQPQPPQMPPALMETKKPQAPKRLWLVTSVIVLLLIVMVVAASQASKSSPSTKSTIETTQANSYHANYPGGAGPQPGTVMHDMDHTLSVGPAQPTHDMDHTLSVGP